MINLIKKFVNKETVTYLVFGVLTTVVNLVTFKLSDMLFTTAIPSVDLTLLTNLIAWIFSVVFAFVTNKIFVFESKSWSGRVLVKEIPSFVGARLLSLGVEELGLLVFAIWLGFGNKVVDFFGLISLSGKMIIKLALSVIIVIMNYVFSKFIIFKSKRKD